MATEEKGTEEIAMDEERVGCENVMRIPPETMQDLERGEEAEVMTEERGETEATEATERVTEEAETGNAIGIGNTEATEETETEEIEKEKEGMTEAGETEKGNARGAQDHAHHDLPGEGPGLLQQKKNPNQSQESERPIGINHPRWTA